MAGKEVSAAEYEEIDKLLDDGSDAEKTTAHETLLRLNESNPNTCDILWRLARSSRCLGAIEAAKGNEKKRQQLILEGVEYGKKAVELDNKSAGAHKWYGICVGDRGNFSGTKEKIQGGVEFKEHVEEAIKLDPGDAILYNLLGRFEFEVASLSSMERRVASWLFAEVPKGTIEGAIEYFQKAEELNPKPWKENRLLLAKGYIQQKKYAEAVSWLDKALEVKCNTTEDESFDAEINKLLKKYESYRGK